MKPIILSLLIGLITQPLFANTVCETLDKTLPGPVDILVEIKAISVVREMTGVISKKSDSNYAIVTKEGSSNFTLASVGSGETSTCRISVDAGMEGDLTEIDLKRGHFVFGDDSNIKLTVTKK